MKKIILIIAMFALGCGTETQYKTTTKVIEVPVEQVWEAVYSVYNESGDLAGEVYIAQDSNNDLFIQTDKLLTQNPNSTYGFFPAQRLNRVSEISPGLVSESKNINYRSQDDLEYGTNSNITGRKYTILEFTLTDKTLKFTATIYQNSTSSNGSINNVLRTIVFSSK